MISSGRARRRGARIGSAALALAISIGFMLPTAAAADDTFTEVAGSPNPAAPGQAVTILGRECDRTTTLHETGSITFTDLTNNVILGTGTLGGSPYSNCGDTTITVSTLAGGAHNIQALYNPGGTQPVTASPAATYTQSITAGASWLQRTPTNTPPARGNQAMAYDRGRGVTVMFGGFTGSTNLGDTWEWDGTDWTQRTPVNSPAPRSDAAMTYDPVQGRTILFGGSNASGHYYSDTWAWDGTNWSQMNPATVPPARFASALSSDTPRGKVVMFGGSGVAGMLADTWEFSSGNWQKITTANAPSARAYFGMAYDSAHTKTVLFSGFDGSSDPQDTWTYDGSNWTNAGPAVQPHARGNYGMAFDASRGVTELIGGCFGPTLFPETWEFDGTTWVQDNLASSPSARFNTAMAYDSARARTVLFGGGSTAACSPSASSPLADTWELAAAAASATPAITNLGLTADEASIAAGAAQVPLASIPAGRIPGLLNAPASSPVGGIPVGGIPVGGIPVGGVPVGGIPVGGIALASSPVGGIPVGGIGLASIPVGGISLNSVLLSSIPGVAWQQLLSGSNLAGAPLQTLTLQQVLNDPVAGPRYNALSLTNSGLTSGLLRGTLFVSVLFGSKPLNSFPVPGGFADWCAYLASVNFSCSGHGVDPAVHGLLGIDIAGAPVGGIPVGGIPVGGIAGGIAGTPVGGIPVGGINLAATPVGGILIRNLPNPGAVVDCARLDCSASGTATLNDAASLSPSAILASAKLQDLGAALNNVTVGQLIPGLLPLSDLSWEKLAIDGLQDIAPTTPAGLHYHVDFDLACTASTPNPAIQVNLGNGERFIAGSSQFVEGATTLTGADPAGAQAPLSDVPAVLTWSSIPGTPCAGQTTGTQHLRLNFRAQPSLDLGTTTSSVTVNAPSPTAASGQAPVAVTQALEPNGDPASAPVINPDTLVLSHLATSGETDFFRVPINMAPGSRVTFYLSHIAQGADFDLTIQKPAPASLLSSPVGGIPVGGIGILDNGLTTHDSATSLAPETLQDIPVGGIPVGGIPVGGIPVGGISIVGVSQNRGNSDEVVQLVTGPETGYYTVQVSGYNNSFSQRPYMLRVKVTPPTQLPAPCPARTFPLGNAGTPGVLPAAANVAAGTKSVFLVNQQRLGQLYGATRASTLMSNLQSFAARGDVSGVVLPVDGDSNVSAAYQAWDANPCSIDARNDVVRKINAVVATYRNSPALAGSLRYVVMVGSDEAIPMTAIPDTTTIANESGEARDLAFLLNNNGTQQANAIYAAEALGYYLSDDAYATFATTPWLGRELYLPSISAARLIETPEEIGAQLLQFGNAGGSLNPKTALVSGYDFLTRGAQIQEQTFSNKFGASNADGSLINDTWGKADLLSRLTAQTGTPDILAINGHYSHNQVESAAGNALSQAGNSPVPEILSTSDLNNASTKPNFAGRVLFTMGCHAGLNIPDTLLPTPDSASGQPGKLLDWAQYYAQQNAAVYVANTGYGLADTDTNALSARLMSIFAQNFSDNSTNIGDKLVLAKHAYYDTMGVYGVYDEKALAEATFYGIPMYHIGPGTSAALAALPSAPPTDSGSGLPTQHLSLGGAQVQTTRVDTSRGSYYAGPTGETQYTHYRPIEPVYDQDVTVSGSRAHSIWLTGLTTADSAITPALAVPTVDLSSHEPAATFSDDLFPANIVHLSRSNTFGQDHQKLVLTLGQYLPGLTQGQGTQRLVSSIQADVIYNSAGDDSPPLITQAAAVRNGSTANVLVQAVDDGQASRVRRGAILYQDGAGWHYAALTQAAGTSTWTTTVTISGSQDIGFLVEMQDFDGNVGYSTKKGALYNSIPQAVAARPSNAPTVAIDSPQSNATYTLDQVASAAYSCSSPIAIVSCSGPVPSGGALDTSTPGTHLFTVTATDLAGSKTSMSRTYTVLYNFIGFQSPVANEPAVNSMHAGRTVPVKWQLTDANGVQVTTLSAVTSIGYSSGNCNGTISLIPDLLTTLDPAGLSYNVDHYQYKWQTSKSQAGTCSRLFISFADGTTQSADFNFN
ncbi:MAG: Kelch repeat-containing protein [Candidatus Dormibacteria bacterium]